MYNKFCSLSLKLLSIFVCNNSFNCGIAGTVFYCCCLIEHTIVAPFSGHAFVPFNGHGHYMVQWWPLCGIAVAAEMVITTFYILRQACAKNYLL